MCYLVECKTCNKTSWKGCGNHLPDLYNRIEKGKHCTCRPWPGVVVVPLQDSADMKTAPPSMANSKSSVPKGKTIDKKA
ncbi:hypothetical protein SDJN02_02014 [Cucurbita argyrosperma subsp. argyrosperma]|nr:hypothetical protein SDJN02_02014 [Cucurbita argyrosperma subsp. argyrosperma]